MRRFRFAETIAISIGLALNLASVALAAEPEQVQRLLKTNQCPGCDLSGADLKDANLSGANLINANLKGANLSGANLSSANLSSADLSGATLNRTYFDRAMLRNTNFSKADLTEAHLEQAQAQGIRLTEATLKGANLRDLNLIGGNLRTADLSGTNLSGASLSGFLKGQTALTDPTVAQMMCQESMPSERRESAAEAGWTMVTADLSGVNLTNANLRGAIAFLGNFAGANLTGADLTDACLAESNLKDAVLDNAELKGARLTNALLAGTSLKGTRNGNLAEVHLTPVAAIAGKGHKEALTVVGSMNRSQMAYFMEHGKFAMKLVDLGPDFKAETELYSYRVFISRDLKKLTMLAALPKLEGHKSYIGLVNATKPKNPKEEVGVMSMLCVSKEAKRLLPDTPKNAPNHRAMSCPNGFEPVQ